MIKKKEFLIIKKEPILIIILPLALIAFLVLYMIRLIILVRFGLIHSDRLGHFLADTELFLCEEFVKKHVTGKSIAGDYDVQNLYRKISTQIILDKKEIDYGEKILKKIGFNNKRIVLFIIRDPKYLKIHYKIKSKSYSYHDHRNDNIKNYKSAILELLHKGFVVIRMGNNAETKLNIKHKNFLDYPFSNIKSDFLDVFLAYKSYFCVSNLTGYDGLITMFRKPLLSIGSMPLGCMYSSSENYYNTIYPHYSKSFRRNLTIKEIFKLKLAFKFNKKEFDKNNVVIKKHSANEIKFFVLEMIDYIGNKYKNLF